MSFTIPFNPPKNIESVRVTTPIVYHYHPMQILGSLDRSYDNGDIQTQEELFKFCDEFPHVKVGLIRFLDGYRPYGPQERGFKTWLPNI